MAKEKQPLMVDLEQGNELTNFTDNEPQEPISVLAEENETTFINYPRWSEGHPGLLAPKHGTTYQKAKEKKPLMVDLEQETELTNFNDNEPPELFSVLDKEKETITGSGPRWSEGMRGPLAPTKHGTTYQKAKVLATSTKPVSSTGYEHVPGLWPSAVNKKYCCIYRVPNRLRRVNPEAYTPQMLLIGPLQHSKKAQALERSKTDLRYLDYMNMEIHKTKYLNCIASKYGEQTVNAFRGIIEEDEQIIRESYAESTDWIKSKEFVEMILQDSVFILGFFIQVATKILYWKGDILFDEPCLINTILEDLMLLENQLPYVLLEKLFEPFLSEIKFEKTFRDIVLLGFQLEESIRKEVKFRHFTDLFRRVRTETLGITKEQSAIVKANPPKIIKNLHNADKLDSAGVDFEDVDKGNEYSLVIKFGDDGILKMPCFIAEDSTERVVRNLMALEQCHYPYSAFICNYIAFLDYLIDTEKDVELLVKKEVVKNWLGHQGSVANMVNKLCLGLVDFGSHYYPIAEKLNNHYKSHCNRSIATLRRVYFNDLWTGTATIAAVVILVLTLIGTVASVLQVTQKDDKPSPPPAPPRLF